MKVPRVLPALLVAMVGAIPSRAYARIPPALVRKEIRAILADPEFRGAQRPSWVTELQDRIAGAVMEFLNSLAEWLPDIRLRPTRFDSAAEWVVAILSYLAIAAVTACVLYVLVQAARRIVSPRVAVPATGPQMAAHVRPRTPEEALRQAAAHAQKGEFREAFRSVYLAILLGLDGKKVLEYSPSKTNWEYVRDLAATVPTASELLKDLTGVFDRRVYRGEECTARDYEAALAVYRRVSDISDGGAA